MATPSLFDPALQILPVLSWLWFVHTGEYYGVAWQTIDGLASLAGVFLVYTGFSLGLRLFLAWKQRQTQSA